MGKCAVLKYLNEAVLKSMSASSLVHSYVSIDPHIDDVVVGGVHDCCIPHLVDASFVLPFTHGSFQHLSFNGCVTQSNEPVPGCNNIGCRWSFLSWE
jgi:hypothetical protein